MITPRYYRKPGKPPVKPEHQKRSRHAVYYLLFSRLQSWQDGRVCSDLYEKPGVPHLSSSSRPANGGKRGKPKASKRPSWKYRYSRFDSNTRKEKPADLQDEAEVQHRSPCLEKNAKLRFHQKILGYNSPKSAKIYLHVSRMTICLVIDLIVESDLWAAKLGTEGILIPKGQATAITKSRDVHNRVGQAAILEKLQ